MKTLQMTPLRVAVLFMQARDELIERAREDRGEIGSWLVLAAGLALLAAFAGQEILGWLQGIIAQLTGATVATP